MTKVVAATIAAGLALVLVPSSGAAGQHVAGPRATGSLLQATGRHVAALQVALRAWGSYDGRIDAIAGPGTRAALRAFQAQAGLPVDGLAGRRTRAALGPLGLPFHERRVLRPGAFGWDVSALQFALTREGLYRWPIDGYFGPETASALRRYQRAQRLTADGVAGPQTLPLLRRARVPSARRPAPSPPSYVVRAGDTLTAIAVRFGTTVPALARRNRIDSNGLLLVGATLYLPKMAVEPSPSDVRDLVNTWASRYDVDPALARALAWMESGYQTNLTSNAGAWGVMQIIPAAWDYVEQAVLGQNVERTPDGNVQVGVALLRQLLQDFGGNERLALGAWYQGAQAVRDRGLYRETKAFVANVLALRSRV